MKTKYKLIREESSHELFKRYQEFFDMNISFKTMATILFMGALYYSGYMRPVFWILVSSKALIVFAFFLSFYVHKIPSEIEIVAQELERRGKK